MIANALKRWGECHKAQIDFNNEFNAQVEFYLCPLRMCENMNPSMNLLILKIRWKENKQL